MISPSAWLAARRTCFSHSTGKPGAERSLVDAMQVMLACVVGGVGLSGKDELHRAFGGVQNAAEPLRVAEDQLGTFVTGEASCETDRKRIRVEQRTAG